ncbi:MAG: phosphotransferase [Eubacteriales bacterium]
MSPHKNIILDESKMIGCGATGAVYQYQDDSIVKLYFSSSALEDIEREKKYAREAFILGIPTAISLGIVKVGEKYGLEYEFIKSRSMSGEIMANPQETETLVNQLVDVAKTLHTTSHKSGSRTSIFDSTKAFFLQHIAINPLFSLEEKELCVQFIESIPDRDTLIHGDFHPGNIMLSGGEAMLIDIADISYGHPIFDLAGLHFTLVEIPVFSTYRNEKGETRIGLTVEKSREVWSGFIEKYFLNIAVAEKDEIIKQIRTLSALRTVCLLTMHNREFSERDRAYFKESISERLMPELPDMIGKINW